MKILSFLDLFKNMINTSTFCFCDKKNVLFCGLKKKRLIRVFPFCIQQLNLEVLPNVSSDPCWYKKFIYGGP